MTDRTGHGGRAPTLAQLIRARMVERGWSYTDLENESAHTLSRGRWQQLGSGAPQKKFPDPASLQVIASVLQVDVTAVVLAAARTVGLDAHAQGSDLANLLPAGTERLSEPMRDAILGLIRAAVSDVAAEGIARGADGTADLTMEWPKSAAPSRRRHNGPFDDGEADTQ